MLVLYHFYLNCRFKDFGIQIPIAYERERDIFENIDSSFGIKELKILDTYRKEDLFSVHEKSFVDRLFGDENELENEIFICFELLKDGQFHRYIPSEKRNLGKS